MVVIYVFLVFDFFWVVISNPKSLDDSKPLNWWPKSPVPTRMFGRLQVYFLFTRFNRVSYGSTPNPIRSDPTRGQSYILKVMKILYTFCITRYIIYEIKIFYLNLYFLSPFLLGLTKPTNEKNQKKKKERKAIYNEIIVISWKVALRMTSSS